jgi:ketosteroid isomerase-like protein
MAEPTGEFDAAALGELLPQLFDEGAGPVRPLSDLSDAVRAERAARPWPEGKPYPTTYEFGGSPDQEPDPDGVARSQGIIRDIYARHGIPLDTPLKEAAEYIGDRAADSGAGQSMWANPEEREEAQYQYAAQGRTKNEVAKRLNDSQHLMDPETARYYRDFARDQDFLVRLTEPPVFGTDGAGGRYDVGPHKEALAYWDSTRNNSPLWSDYHRNNKDGAWIAHALSDPDTLVGSTFMGLEQSPDFIRLAGSGESDGAAGAFRDMRGVHRDHQRYRAHSPAPIGNLPSAATVEDRQRAIAELQAQTSAAAIPVAAERWARTTGWVPPGVVQDVGDGLISTLDATFAIPVVGAAAKGTSLGLKAAKVAGKGWTKPALQQFGRQTAASFGWDQVPEQGLNLGIPVAIAPEFEAARRSKPGYWRGSTDKDEVQAAMKSPEKLQEAKDARKQLYETADPERVSAARARVKDRLIREGRLPYEPLID